MDTELLQKDTVMQELIMAKDLAEADDSKEDASEEIIVTPNRASYGGGKFAPFRASDLVSMYIFRFLFAIYVK